MPTRKSLSFPVILKKCVVHDWLKSHDLVYQDEARVRLNEVAVQFACTHHAWRPAGPPVSRACGIIYTALHDLLTASERSKEEILATIVNLDYMVWRTLTLVLLMARYFKRKRVTPELIDDAWSFTLAGWCNTPPLIVDGTRTRALAKKQKILGSVTEAIIGDDAAVFTVHRA